jgi:hypothetical protein
LFQIDGLAAANRFFEKVKFANPSLLCVFSVLFLSWKNGNVLYVQAIHSMNTTLVFFRASLLLEFEDSVFTGFTKTASNFPLGRLTHIR